ncbi:unnamed protein product, partial [marine sediment metagenome]
VNGRFNKLDRVEKLEEQGRINKKQIIDILTNAIRLNPKWMQRLPEKYKAEISGQTNVQTIVNEEMKNHVVRDVNYFKSLSLAVQGDLLQQYGAEIGQAFAKELSRYRGLYHPFWINTPENVRPYIPFEIIDATAQYYVNEINKNPSNQDSIIKMISPDIQPFVFSKLGSSKNWYKKAQLDKESGMGKSFMGLAIPFIALLLGASIFDIEKKIQENPQELTQQIQQIQQQESRPQIEPQIEQPSKQIGLTTIDLDKIWEIESSRGTDPNMGNSSAGARGHYQFMEKLGTIWSAEWEKLGLA